MTDKEFLEESVTKGLVGLLMSERGLTLLDALALLGESETFACVLDEETGLYRESPSYIYEILSEELFR